MAGEKKFPIRL